MKIVLALQKVRILMKYRIITSNSRKHNHPWKTIDRIFSRRMDGTLDIGIVR